MTALLPANMRSKVAVELCPVAGLDGFCWTWTACLNSKGYGCVAVDGKSQLAHRVAYQIHRGDIPSGLQIDHLCVNKRCCNPSHLEAVTGKVNSERSWPALKTLCINGHELSGENLIIKKRGHRTPVRNCRICQIASQRRARSKAAALVAA